MAPHAGLIFSGACAARVFAQVMIPEVVVIVAPNHTGRLTSPGGASLAPHTHFQTPFGDVAVDQEFGSALCAATGLIAPDADAHAGEHAIEVELPFIRTLAPESAIVPIVLAWDDWPRSRELGAALAEVVRECNRRVLLVASSDMTHYEPAERARRQDALALRELERLDGEALLSVCAREQITMCGRAPAATVAEAARALGATAASVVDYRHSGDVTGDDSSVVAYAGAVMQ
jgi:AmmeMemoRadiSam system protein B